VNKTVISQRDHISVNFGNVLRSSAIFYFKAGANFKTTISFMNYWSLKRGLEVTVVASVRTMDGSLVSREELNFSKGMVINYSPALGEFEGSVEIEVFSLKNLVIPYAAIMAIYESKNGISMVHSYGRTYSHHEIEEGRTITVGEESCWTLRDAQDIRSFCVFHNGGKLQPAQTATLNVSTGGKRYEAIVKLPELKPYSTVKLYPSDYINNLPELLNGRTGNASLKFKLSDSFTRMLVGNEAITGTDFQATHSNFNYSEHQTDVIEEDSVSYMYIPSFGLSKKHVLVYPDSHPGEYEASYLDTRISFRTGDAPTIPVTGGTMKFKRLDGPMPTRIVTALVCENENGLLPVECSLGVENQLRPVKRMWWLVCAADDTRKSRLILNETPELCGTIPGDAKIHVRLYSHSSSDYIEQVIAADQLERLGDGISIEEIFPEAKSFLNGEFGYLTAYCDRNGITCYTLLENETGSFALEHGF
jgi:hypothetical protein